MKVRTWGLAIRLLAVAAAIYAFFSLRSQFGQQQQSHRGAIPVKVVSQNVCGTLTVHKIKTRAGDNAAVVTDITPSLARAIQNPDKLLDVHNQQECEKLAAANGGVVHVNNQLFTVEFKTPTQ